MRGRTLPSPAPKRRKRHVHPWLSSISTPVDRGKPVHGDPPGRRSFAAGATAHTRPSGDFTGRASHCQRRRAEGAQRSRKVRATCSETGWSRYCSGVRSPVEMKTSAGMPGTMRKAPSSAAASGEKATRARYGSLVGHRVAEQVGRHHQDPPLNHRRGALVAGKNADRRLGADDDLVDIPGARPWRRRPACRRGERSSSRSGPGR